MIPALIEHLRATQNPDGGWGAVRGRQSNTEATAFATLALHAVAPGTRESADRGLGWLRTGQLPDGSWPLAAGSKTGSWTSALAVTCLKGCGDEGRHAERGADWLLEHRGKTPGLLTSVLYRVAPDRMPVRMNPQLTGWSWTANEFSWVEPTAYALIALKKLGRHRDKAASARVAEAERMLDDRACEGGGWNYGNSWVFGEAVPAYLETTAITLIALQDRRGEERQRTGLAALKRMVAEAASGFGLSWATLCLRIHGETVVTLLRRLAEVHARTAFLGETKAVALALLAAGDGARTLEFA